MTEPFDAVLAEYRRCRWRDRLSAAHAAEVAEARRTADYWKAELIEANKVLDTLRRQSEETVRALHAEATEHKARAEAAERDARELRDTLREARRWIGDGDMGDGLHRSIWTPAYTAIVDRVDAAIATTEQAAGGIVRDGGES